MNRNSYSTTIEVTQTPDAVCNAICDVTNWWSKDFAGNSRKPGDEFIIDHPGQHYSKQKVMEFIPGKKIVWQVTESQLNWLKSDKQEWTNTRLVFDLSSNGEKTVLCFTHEGLTSGKECYDMCEKGWNIVVKDWLQHLITTGKQSEGMANATKIREQHLELQEKNTSMK